jgi:hypothetical protein
VVHGQEQDVVDVAELQQARAEQRAAGEIERLVGIDHRESARLSLALRLGHLAEIDEGEAELPARRDDLHRTSLDGDKRGPQRLMAPDDLVQALLEL